MPKTIINFTSEFKLFRLTYNGWYDQDMPDGHCHPRMYEIYYLFSGERCFHINGRSFSIQAGDLLLIKPNVLHKATNTDNPGCERIAIYFRDIYLPSQFIFFDELAPLFENQYLILSFPIDQQSLVEDLFKRMLQEINSRLTGLEPLLQSLMVQLLVYLCRQAEKSRNTHFEHSSPIHTKIFEIVKHINRCYMEPVTIPSLSKRFYISPSYMSKVFKEVVGLTLVEYLNNIRIKEAKKLLVESEMKVIMIADQVGFESITHFGRVFKEITGYSPLSYRRLTRL